MKKVTAYNQQVTVKILLSLSVALFLFLYPVPYSLSPVHAQTASLALSPASGTFNRSCPFSLDIKLNTGGAQTDGTDAILIYDPSRFSATSITPNTATYPDFPGNNIDDVNGKITISGLASVASAYSGSGTLAAVNFTVRDNVQTGVSQIKFDFDPADKAKTTDSNVVQRGTVSDILNSVVNGSYTVGSGTCAAASPGPVVSRGAPGISTPSAQQPSPTPPALTALPQRGTIEVTATLGIVGAILTVLGILGLVVL